MMVTDYVGLALPHGWRALRWHDWQGKKAIVSRMDPGDPECCTVCGVPMRNGDAGIPHAYTSQWDHYTCVYPDNRPDHLVGFWTAAHWEDGSSLREAHRRVYVAVGGDGAGAYIPRHMVDPGETGAVTENSTEEERTAAQWAGLERLRAIILEYETGAREWPEWWPR